MLSTATAGAPGFGGSDLSTLLDIPLPHHFLIALLPTRRNAASTGSSQCCVVVVFIAVVYPSDR